MNAHQPTASQEHNAVRILHKAENGSMDGGAFADVAFIPYLIGVMIVGIFFALVGFWRVGASLSTQISAQAGSVAAADGNAALSAVWQLWTRDSGPAGGFSVNPTDRSVNAELLTGRDMDYLMFGLWQMPIGAQSQSRMERFYPGGPECSDGVCDE
jgi:hypothetical protein